MSVTRTNPDGAPTVDELAEEFVARLRNGESPSIEDYVARFPQLAREIRDLFPAMALLEQLKQPASPPSAAPVARQAAEAITFSAGRSFGDFTLVREIGRGGMGVVYEAEQASLGRRVALKMLPRRLSDSPTGRERFQREARAVARLHHTNIVPVFGNGECEGVHYYVMQYIAGEGLDVVLGQVRRLRRGEMTVVDPCATATLAFGLTLDRFAPPASTGAPADDAQAATDHERTAQSPVDYKPSDQPRADESSPSSASQLTPRSGPTYCVSVARIGLQVADALAYAHGQGVLHRDIKPSNLLLDLQGTVWLTDFGLAKDLDSGELTKTGDLVGTLRYMAPERLRGRSLPEGDVYSLGLTLYELLTLRPAVDESDPGQVLSSIGETPPPAPRSIDPQIPRDLETIVMKCLAKAPEDRYRLAVDLAEDLRRFLGDRPILARRFGWPERSWRWCRRNPVVASLTAAVALLVTALAVYGNWSAKQFRDKHDEAVQNLDRAETAETDVRQRNEELRSTLADALFAQAHALRISGEPGCRLETLELLEQSAAIKPNPALRNEVIAALTLFDARPKRLLARLPFHDVDGIAFDPSFTHFACVVQGHDVRLHASADGREIARSDCLHGGKLLETRLQFTPDGGTLVIAARKKQAPAELWAWDLSAPQSTPRRLWQGEFDPHFAMTPDGKTLALALPAGGLQRLDLATGELGSRVATSQRVRWGKKHTPAFDPSGTRLAFALHDQPHVIVWDVVRDQRVAQFTLPDEVTSVAWNSDGRLLACGCDDHQAYVFDVEQGRKLSAIAADHSAPLHVAFAPPNDWLVSWGTHRQLRVSDPVLGTTVLVTRGYLCGRSADGRRWGVLDDDRLSDWEVAPPLTRQLARHRFTREVTAGAWMDGPRSMDISPDGRLLATADLDGLRLIALAPQVTELAWIRGSGFDSVAFGPEGKSLLASSPAGLQRWPLTLETRDGLVTLEVGSPTPFGPKTVDGRPPFFVEPSRNWLLLCDNSAHESRLLRLDGDSPAGPVLKHRNSVGESVSRDGSWAITSPLEDQLTIVWNARTGERVHEWPGHPWAAFSPDGEWLLLRTVATTTLRLIRTGTWREERTLACRDSSFCRPVVSPDGRILALCDSFGIRLIDFHTLEDLAELPAGRDAMEHKSVVFSPDSATLVSLRRGHVAFVWDLRAIRSELKRRNLDWNHPDLAPPPTFPPIQQTRIGNQSATLIRALLNELLPR